MAQMSRYVDVFDARTLTFGMALRIDLWPAGDFGSVAAIYSDPDHSASIVLDANAARGPWLIVNDQSDASAASQYAITLPTGTAWFSLALALHVTGATSTIDVLVNGASVVGGPKPGPPIPFSSVGVWVGLYASNYAPKIQWSIDDVYGEVQ
jgi:hypothetical protein